MPLQNPKYYNSKSIINKKLHNAVSFNDDNVTYENKCIDQDQDQQYQQDLNYDDIPMITIKL